MGVLTFNWISLVHVGPPFYHPLDYGMAYHPHDSLCRFFFNFFFYNKLDFNTGRQYGDILTQKPDHASHYY